MKRMPRPRQLAYVLVAALLLTAAPGGVGYAAGSSSTNVSACVNGKGRLALQNAKGKCPRKFSKVAIAKQGPRGATGPRGGTGQTGPQGQSGPPGPGATAVVQDFTAVGDGTQLVVGELAYTPRCSTGNVALVVVKAVSSGANVSVHGLRTYRGTVESVTASTTASPTIVFADRTGSTEVASGVLVFSGTTVQTVSFSVTALAAGAPGGVLCRIRGTITPAA